jgi:hypothetical protein
MSMGGEEAIGAAAADGRIAAVVAEGATGRVSDDHDWLSDVYGWRGAVQEGVQWLTSAVTELLTSADRPPSLRSSIAAASPRPVLLVAAGDVPDEGHAARWMRAVSPATVAVWEVPGVGHTDAFRARPEEWTARVVGFLDAALGR